MPLFEIVCDECNKTQEKLCRKLEELELKIEECESQICKARLAFSAPALSFKGSGFYITDYKNSSVVK